jgi:cobalamin biosynthesis protein CbiG
VNLWIGMGCQSAVPVTAIEAAIQSTLERHGLERSAIIGLATLDIKKPIATTLCQKQQWQLQLFTAEELAKVATLHPVAAVAQLVGTPSVAEAAAFLAAGRLLIPKEVHQLAGKYITIAIGSID